jgi:hypothetical protein
MPDDRANGPGAEESPAELRERLAADERRIAELEARNAALAAEPGAAGGAKPRVCTRRFWVALLLVLGTILTPVTIVALYVRNEIGNTDRYVQTVKPLASNAAIQSYVADKVSTQLFAQVDVSKYVKNALPDKAQPLAGPLTSALEGFVRTATMRVLRTSRFQDLWISANRLAHTQLVNALTGEKHGAVVPSKNGAVTVDLSAVAALVEKKLAATGIDLFKSIPIARVAGRITIFQSNDLYKARRAFGLLDTIAFLLPFMVVACFGGAIFLSRRRRRAFVLAAVGFTLGAILLAIGLSIGRSIYLDAVTSQNVPYDAAAAMYDTLVRLLHTSVRAVASFGLIIVIAVFFAGPSRFARWYRTRVRWTANWLGHETSQAGWSWLGPNDFVVRSKAVMRIVVAVLGFLVLFFWKHPTPSDILLLAVVTLLLLAVIEFFGREPLVADEPPVPVAA